MINTPTLRAQYKRERNQSSRDAVIGSVILLILGGITCAVIVRGACLLVVAIHG